MYTPKVSIIIPARNEEKYIAATLEAVTRLSYPHFKIIVVDNNSTDRTSEIARTFPNVIVLREERKGTQFARECGRKQATGEIIANIDADCLPETDWLIKGVRFFESANTVAVSGPYDYFDGSPFFRSTTLLFQKILYVTGNSICRIFRLGGIVIGGNCLFRASALEKMGGYNTAITFYGDDTDSAKRISRFGKVIFTDRVRMKTSARRFQNQGIFKIVGTYFYYFFKTIFSS